MTADTQQDGLSRSPQRKRETELTPLAQRLVLALRHVAEQHDEAVMVVKGFERYMRRNGMPDDTIRDGLLMIRQHIDAVLDDNTDAVRA